MAKQSKNLKRNKNPKGYQNLCEEKTVSEDYRQNLSAVKHRETSKGAAKQYMLFCFVLWNDVPSAEKLLQTTGIKLHCDLTLSKIINYDKLLLGGILQSKRFLQLFNFYAKERYDAKNVSPYGPADNLNLLEMACLINHNTEYFDMISLLIGYQYPIASHVCIYIIANPNVNLTPARALLENLVWQPTSENMTSFFNQEALCALVKDLIKSFYSESMRNPVTLDKIKTTLEIIRDDLEDEKSYLTCIRFCVEQSIEHKNSSFLNFFQDQLSELKNDGNLKDECERTMERFLITAVKFRSHYIVHLLVTSGVDINCENLPDKRGEPLFCAIQNSDLMLMFYLLERGAKTNIRRQNLRLLEPDTPLGQAMKLSKSPFTIKWLLCCHGAHLNQTYLEWFTHRRTTPLIHEIGKCMRSGHLRNLKILLRLGADIDMPNDKQCTPLHEAVRMHNVPAIRFLLYHNADINKGFGNAISLKEMPITQALQQRDYHIVKLLLICGAHEPRDGYIVDIRTLPPIWCGNSHIEAERKWLEKWLQKPHSLKHYCRIAIRKSKPGKKLERFLISLKYPKRLKDYISTKLLFC